MLEGVVKIPRGRFSAAGEAVRRGRILRAQGRRRQAAEAFLEALALCPRETDAYWHNTALNELEITEGAAELESKPRSLNMVLSNRCNIECVMCSVWDNPWEMPERALREVSELFPTLGRLMWQGGEVFMSPRFEPLFDLAAAHLNLQQHITTNGLLFSRSLARKIIRSNSALILSIDGATKTTYERVRKKGRFERLLEGIRLLNEARDERAAASAGAPVYPLTMNVTIMRSNYRELERFAEFAHEHRFQTLQINPVDTSGPEDIFRCRDREALPFIEEAVPRMKERAARLGLILHVWLPSSRSPELIREPKPGIEKLEEPKAASSQAVPAFANEIGCFWPWQDLWIDQGGRVRPHCFCGWDIGNVKDDSLMALWNNETMQGYRRRLHANAAAGWCSNRCVEGAILKEALGLDG